MTKADLIDEVSKLSNLTKKETETIVNTIFDNITDALGKGDKVELRGFGGFRIRHRNSRKGRNPKTPSSVDVPQKRAPVFQGGKRARELGHGGAGRRRGGRPRRGPGGGRGHHRSPARPRRAALERRHELHDGLRRRARHARGARGDVRPAPGPPR